MWRRLKGGGIWRANPERGQWQTATPWVADTAGRRIPGHSGAIRGPDGRLMVFRRRDRRTLMTILREMVWPRGGWRRGLQYIGHRINRLPDRPERIARGIFAGVMVSFTPFFGLHLGLALGLAWLLRGNFLAALLGSFFGNPVTIPLIAVGSVELGRRLLGTGSKAEIAAIADTGGMTRGANEDIAATFAHAFSDLHHNLLALFTADVPKWEGLTGFFHGVFLPYLVGGLIPGLIASFACYGLALSVVRTYQARRQAKLRDRLATIRRTIAQQRAPGGIAPLPAPIPKDPPL